jgi:hypothetical protein
MAAWGKKETQAEKDDKKLANELADETPADQQVGLYPDRNTPQLGPFGAKQPSLAGGRKEKG